MRKIKHDKIVKVLEDLHVYLDPNCTEVAGIAPKNWDLGATQLANGNWLVMEMGVSNNRLTGYISKQGEYQYTLDK